MGIMDFLISQNIPSLIGNMSDFQRAINPNSPVLMNEQGIPRTTETAINRPIRQSNQGNQKCS